MKLLRCFAAAAALAALAACGPNLGGLEKGEAGRVAAASGGDRLELEDGLSVLLAEIDAPAGEAAYARAAAAELEALALNRKVRLGYGGQRRLGARAAPASVAESPAAVPTASSPPGSGSPAPQRETAIAHVFVQSEGGRWIWLNHALVAKGAAFVRPRPDNNSRSAELFEAEVQAREAGLGLWADPAYRVMTPREAEAAAASLTERCQSPEAPFAFVEGVIAEVDAQERRAVMRFARRGESQGFSLVIFGRAFSEWRGPALQTYEGKRVRARGRLETFRPRDAPEAASGFAQMCIDDAGALELVGATD